jgi:hypothetical protein
VEASSNFSYYEVGQQFLCWYFFIRRYSSWFSEGFEFITTDHVSRLFKSKINFTQYGFTKPRSPVTNLVTFLDTVTALVCSQGQTDSIYFDFSSAFDIIPHGLLLHKINNYGLPSGYLNWFCSYLTVSYVRICSVLSSLCVVRCTSRKSLEATELIFLLIIYVTQWMFVELLSHLVTLLL